MGGFVGYGAVKETQRDLNTGNINGYTVTYFDNQPDDSPGAENYKIIPYPPFTGNSWTYGRLLRKSVYKAQGTGAALVRDEKRGYSSIKYKGGASGEAFFISRYIMPGSNYPFWNDNYHEYQVQEYFKHATFQYTSAYSTLDSVVVTTYDDNGRANIVKEEFDYDTTTILPKQTKKNDSKGDLTYTNILRANDYGNLSATDDITGGIKLLQQRHVYAPEIEISNFKANADGTNARLLSSYFFSYRPDAPWKNKVYNVENNTPVTNFTSSRNLSGAVTKDSRYVERLSFNQYDAKGNLIEQQKTNDLKESYLWGYGGLYPVAKITGAPYDTAKKYITPGILDNPTDDTQLRTELANLRTKLPYALVTTYTYSLLLGITSETDPSGKTIFYEYDGQGRLRLIKDQNGKILKQYDYQYKKSVTQ
jgi:YD repeat-containing protein